MKRIFIFGWLVFSCISVQAQKWEDNFSSLDTKRWSVFGKYNLEPGQGLRLGSEEGSFASSGVLCETPVGAAGKTLVVTVDFEKFKVDLPAPHEGTNEVTPHDLMLNVDLSGDRGKNFVESGMAACLVGIYFKEETGGGLITIRGKQEGRPFEYEDNLATQVLDTPFRDLKCRVVIKIKESSIHVALLTNGTSVWDWAGSLPAAIGDKPYLRVYEQNILTGRGTVLIKKVSVETTD